MNNNLIEKLTEISNVFSSKKRITLLIFLTEQPANYSILKRNFAENRINIVPSEMYKHINFLEKYNYINKKGKTYMITSKGLKVIDMISIITDEVAIIPKIKYDFNGEQTFQKSLNKTGV